MFDRVHARLAREEGIALVMAVIVVSALTISTAAIVQLTTSNQVAFTRDRLEQRAFNTAEEGLSEAVAALRSIDDGTVGTVALGDPVAVQGSSATPIACCSSLGGWWAEKRDADRWTIWAIGRAPNGEVLRTLSTQVKAEATTINTEPSLAWAQGFFVGDASTCTTMVGTATLKISVWVAGDLCLNGTQQITEPNLSGTQTVYLHVGGYLKIVGGATVGTSSRPIAAANIVKGCIRNSVGRNCHVPASSHVYANADAYTSAQSTLTKPVVDPDDEYAEANWSSPVCSTGSFAFDNDTTRNNSLGAVDLFPASDYDCRAFNAASEEVGRMRWDAATGEFRLEGKVFIDGDLSFAGGDSAYYPAGSFGAIYVNGSVSATGNSTFCGPPTKPSGSACNGDDTDVWDSDLGAVGIVAINSNNVSPGWNMAGNAEFNVLVYVNGLFKETGTSFVTGPVVTDRAIVAGTPEHTADSDPPPELEGGGSTTSAAVWSAVPGTWRQLPNGYAGS